MIQSAIAILLNVLWEVGFDYPFANYKYPANLIINTETASVGAQLA